MLLNIHLEKCILNKQVIQIWSKKYPILTGVTTGLVTILAAVDC